MSEVRLTTTGSSTPIAPASGVAPTIPVQTPPVVAPPPPHGAPAVSLAGSLASLGAGDRLEGVVIGQDATGAPILRTANGSFLLITEQPIPDNTHVVLQILSTGNPIQAVILTQDGVPLQPPPEAELILIRPEVAATVEALALADVTGSLVKHQGSSRLLAIVLPDPLAALPGGTRPLPPGSALVLQLARTTSHVPSAPASPSPVSEHSGPSTAPTRGNPHAASGRAATNADPAGPIAVPSSAAGSISPAGSPAKHSVVANEAAAAAIGEAPRRGFVAHSGILAQSQSIARGVGGTLLGSRIIGIVAAEPAAGQVLVRASMGLLSIATPMALSVGEALAFDLVSVTLPAKPSASAAEAFGDPLSRLSHGWPALRDALLAWQTVDPAAARLMADNVLPRTTERLASGLLFLFAALRAGDASAWLGKSAMQKLEHNGYRDLARRLGEDFADLSRLGQQASHGDWRAVPLPIYDGRTLTQIMLFARHHENQQDEDSGRDLGTRFILDVELSVTGPVQLDGLVQRGHFDLIVRAHTPLPAEIRHGVGDIFQAGLKATLCRGTIAFQVSQHFQTVPLVALRGNQTATALVV